MIKTKQKFRESHCHREENPANQHYSAPAGPIHVPVGL